MCIAQHFVAGEDVTRPPEITDTETLSTDAVNLPWMILRAVHQASRIDGIPTRARSVLAALARTVDAKNPYGQIFARRALLTERAMQSERTFYRSLADLEAAGLVERPAQHRYVQAGLFGRAYLHLTERAAILLGLVEPPATLAEEPSAAAPARAFPPPPDKVADGGIYKDLYPVPVQKRQPGQLPLDLQRLRSLGFRDFLIFKLMREAREHGKRLSDVVEATWEHLKKASRPICYLRALLASTTDFSFQVRSHEAEQDAVRAAKQDWEAAESLVRKVAGQSFIDATGERKLVVDADGLSLSVYHVGEGVARRGAGQWQLRFAKALRAGQIRQAQPSDLEAFAQARRHTAAAAIQSDDTLRITTGTVANHLALLKGTLRRFSPALAKTV